jgi:CheY-like chemotaxis protein
VQTIEIIEETAFSMSFVLNEALSFQKIEEGRLILEKKPFNLRTILMKAIKTFKVALDNKRIQLSFKYDANISELLEGDAIHIRQVIQNLISNSINFSPEDSLLTIEAVRMHASDFKTCSVKVSVKDQGVGLTDEDKAKLFKPYIQIRPGDLQDGRGSGLGLSICKEIVEAHGGFIGVNSQSGKGAEFFFQIPFERSYQPEMKQPVSNIEELTPTSIGEKSTGSRSFSFSTSESCSPTLAAQRLFRNDSLNSVMSETSFVRGSVLVVDDVRTNRRLLEVALQKLGFKVDCACDGVEALEKMVEHTNQYSLVFLDNVMPRMAGVECARKIRLQHPGSKIIGVTGNALAEDIEEFKSAGAAVVLVKPVRLDTLRNTISEIVE